MINRHGGEIEYDLHHYCSLDLVDFFRGRYSWRKLYAMVARFPQNSTLRVAIAQDEELAWRQVDQEIDTGDGRPPLSEWSLNANLLAAIVDRLGELISVTATQPGKKPARVRPVPRPRTAMAKVIELKAQKDIDELLSSVRYEDEE